jgi:hypothetical protein
LSPHQQWDQVHASPEKRKHVSIQIQLPYQPGQIDWDCPEISTASQILEFHYANGMLTFQIPQLDYLGLVIIHE